MRSHIGKAAAALLAAAFIIALSGCGDMSAIKEPTQSAASVSASPSPSPSPSPIPQTSPPATPTPSPTLSPTPAPTPVDVKLPYMLLVNKAAQIVTVHTLDESGQYTIVVRQMLCSTGYTRKRTPEGLYTLKAERYPIAGMVDGTKARYAIRMTGSYLFHSVPYRNNNPDSMYGEKYNAIGTMSSLGCIRLVLADIHWLYENCPAGTPVEIIWGEEDPELWNRLKRSPVSFEYGWDPTDPDSPGYVAPEPTVYPTRCPWVTPAPLSRPFAPEYTKFSYTPTPSPEPTPAPPTQPPESQPPSETPAAPPTDAPSVTDAPPEEPEPTVAPPKEPEPTVAP